MIINVLLNDNFFNDHSTYCFVYPIIKSINLIKESGIQINFIYSTKKNIFDCNILIIESRFCIGIEKKKLIKILLKDEKLDNIGKNY